MLDRRVAGAMARLKSEIKSVDFIDFLNYKLQHVCHGFQLATLLVGIDKFAMPPQAPGS